MRGVSGPAVAEAADAAAFGLVQAMWLYGIAKPRGWSTPIFEALVVLHPEAAEHLREHEDPEATMRHFWPARCAP